jgi:hypothetical protein
LKTIRNEQKTNFKNQNKCKLKLSKTNCFVCDWIGCDFNTNTNRKLRLHQRIHKPIVKQEIIVKEEEERDEIPKKYPSGRPKKGEPPRPLKLKKRVWNADKCPCSWPGCEKSFPTNNKLVKIITDY